MDEANQKKWDRAAGGYDRFGARAAEKRWAAYKREMFSSMSGKILFLAVGTGLDVQFFPPGQDVTGIDISPEMLERAQPRIACYNEHHAGKFEALHMDVHDMSFADESFDQVYTSCTFCSVPRPVEGLKQLRRVLKPGGELRLFEHTGSRWFPFSVMLHLMTPFSRIAGPEVNRPTVDNVRAAGFEVVRVVNHYLDIVKSIEARKG